MYVRYQLQSKIESRIQFHLTKNWLQDIHALGHDLDGTVGRTCRKGRGGGDGRSENESGGLHFAGKVNDPYHIVTAIVTRLTLT